MKINDSIGIHVCVCACLCACVHVCMFVCVHVCMFVCVHVKGKRKETNNKHTLQAVHWAHADLSATGLATWVNTLSCVMSWPKTRWNLNL